MLRDRCPVAENLSETDNQVFTQTCLNELELQPNITDAATVKPPCFIRHIISGLGVKH